MRRPRVQFPRTRRFQGRIPRVGGAWVPGALTIGNLLGGYAAILAGAERHFLVATLCIFAAAIFDALDGRVARMMGHTSAMGAELDSLCDAVSFAVAPSMLMFHMGLIGLGRIGYAVCFLFAACGVLRLARFNTLPVDHYNFVGLPIPTAAAAIVTPALLTRGEALPSWYVPWHAGVVAVIALLMVSRIKYRTFKDLRFREKRYRLLAIWAAVLAGFVAFAEWMIPALILCYLLSPLVLRSAPAAHDAHEHAWHGTDGAGSDETPGSPREDAHG